MPEKPKRHNKTKDEILKDMENQVKTHAGRKFVREEFFPILCEASESINDADVFLQSFSNMVMESFMSEMKLKKFEDLKLSEKLDAKSPMYGNILKLVTIFNGKTVREAQDLIDGMKDEIRFFYREEMKTRKLETIKTKWLE